MAKDKQQKERLLLAFKQFKQVKLFLYDKLQSCMIFLNSFYNTSSEPTIKPQISLIQQAN